MEKHKKIDHNKVYEEREARLFGRHISKEILDYIKLILGCVIAMYLLLNFILHPIRISGNSMQPSLANADFGIYNVFSAKFLGVNRFDVVVVEEKADGVVETIVKRVVGIPGDHICYENGILYVNGEKIEENYIIDRPEERKKGADFTERKLHDDEYFLLGDNRNHSVDSRVMGVFHRSSIIGNGILVVFPFHHFKIVGNPF